MPCLYADMLVATWKWTNSLLCFSSRSRWYPFFENRKQPFMKTGRKGGKMKCGIRLELHLVFKAKLAVQFLFFKCASVTLESVGMPWGSIYIYIYVVIACNSKQLPYHGHGWEGRGGKQYITVWVCILKNSTRGDLWMVCLICIAIWTDGGVALVFKVLFTIDFSSYFNFIKY